MRRRHWLTIVALTVFGCSSATKKRKSGSTTGRKRMNRGPQTFGNLLVAGYMDDLKSGPAEKKIAAARELGNMGADAKPALPLLEKLGSDKNAKVSAAAKSAAAAIRKR